MNTTQRSAPVHASPASTLRALQAGDQVDLGTGLRTILQVRPYRGTRQSVNVVLTVQRHYPSTGEVTVAYDDPALRPARSKRVGSLRFA